MIVLTVFNHAGGAGKASITRDVGHTLATWGLRTLLVDLDPQANLTDWLGITDVSDDRTVLATAVNEAPLPDPVTVHGMDVIPSNVTLTLAEGQMTGRPGVHLNLLEALRETQDRYEAVLIDSPPASGNSRFSARWPPIT